MAAKATAKAFKKAFGAIRNYKDIIKFFVDESTGVTENDKLIVTDVFFKWMISTKEESLSSVRSLILYYDNMRNIMEKTGYYMTGERFNKEAADIRQFNRLITKIKHIPNLEALYIYGHPEHTVIPDFSKTNKNLKIIEFMNIKDITNLNNIIKENKSLEIIRCINCNIGTIPESISATQNLHIIDFNDNKIKKLDHHSSYDIRKVPLEESSNPLYSSLSKLETSDYIRNVLVVENNPVVDTDEYRELFESSENTESMYSNNNNNNNPKPNLQTDPAHYSGPAPSAPPNSGPAPPAPPNSGPSLENLRRALYNLNSAMLPIQTRRNAARAASPSRSRRGSTSSLSRSRPQSRSRNSSATRRYPRLPASPPRSRSGSVNSRRSRNNNNNPRYPPNNRA